MFYLMRQHGHWSDFQFKVLPWPALNAAKNESAVVDFSHQTSAMDPKISSDNYSEYFLDSNKPTPKEEEYTCYLCNATYEKGIL